jgi:hypothetical protein
MKNFTQSLKAFADVEKAYAKELIPCQDGSMADPSIGCVNAPGSIVSSDASMTEIILQVASVLMSVVMVVSVLLLIWAGVIYAMAAGDDYKIQKSKKMMMWSVIGLVVALLARVIVKVIIISV